MQNNQNFNNFGAGFSNQQNQQGPQNEQQNMFFGEDLNFNQKRRKTKNSSNSSKQKKNINGRRLIITTMTFNSIFFFALINIFVSLIVGSQIYQILSTVAVSISFISTLVCISILTVNLVYKKWYIYVVLYIIGIFTALTLTMACSIMLLNDLKTKLIPYRIQGYRWELDNNVFDGGSQAKNTFDEFKTEKVEDVEIVTNILVTPEPIFGEPTKGKSKYN
ncbi:hypothetical protein [Mycoplasmopsis primatum]|uniref:hypothetical protein n=1 Tax=Mycoplasmopsis primatum TaxID=55604 RepID=UPI0004973C50|nr:hypothetical protein [Mycoplasmopsis primatum]